MIRAARSSSNFFPLRLVAAIAVLALLAVGCGSDDDSADATATSVTEPVTETTVVETTTTEQAPETNADVAGSATPAVATFFDCMGNRGVEIPELGVDADGNLILSDVLTEIDLQNTGTQIALFSCQTELDNALGGRLTELLTSPEVQETLVEFSQCVRDGGYEVPELTVTGLLAGALAGNAEPDPRGDSNSVAPLLAGPLGLDGQDATALDTIDGCASGVEQSLVDLGLL